MVHINKKGLAHRQCPHSVEIKNTGTVNNLKFLKSSLPEKLLRVFTYWRNATWNFVNPKFNWTRSKTNQDRHELTGTQVSGKVHYGLGYSHWGVGAWVGTLTKRGQ